VSSYIIRRFSYMVVVLVLVSVIAFIIIQIPPGDYVSTYQARLKNQGMVLLDSDLAALRAQYGLDSPIYVQYFKWVGNMLHGNLGMSLSWNKPVNELLFERLPLTVALSLLSLIFTFVFAILIGIYSATHQYSFGDYLFTAVGFIGLATPSFLLALVLMMIFYRFFNISIGSLFSEEYRLAAWSMAKFLDMLKHLIIPIVVMSTAGSAGLIRVMRGCLLDELQKQYVVTARAKGVKERTLLFRYPVRVAVNPIISTIGWVLPEIISGGVIVSIVLNIPTIGPLLFTALLNQDMYLSGSAVMILTFLTVIGTFISDILLIIVDPRIRYERGT
jgi:peptide/nickel transport system permease protein